MSTNPELPNMGADTDATLFDFFEVEEQAVVINRRSDVGWVWSRGKWQYSTSIVARCYSDGRSLGQDEFVHLFPFAALELLQVD